MRPTPTSCRRWQLKRQSLEFGALPCIMGIVNVTPDSFSDGGRHHDATRAIEHALKLVEQGADILDIGGESTRPYSTPVAMEEERDRVIPVIEGIVHRTDVPISIDTSKASVAEAALAAGAEIINDVTGLEGDPRMIEVAVSSGAGICAMHMQGNPQTMQDNPTYEAVVDEIIGYLLQRRDWLIDQGVTRDRICLDPGIGFGKTHQHNLDLIAQVDRFHATDCPILVGHSRKGFIKKFSHDESAERVAGTLAVSLGLARARIQVIRVHDVLETRQGLRMQQAVADAWAARRTPSTIAPW
jgi:dihydropteroate synthase